MQRKSFRATIDVLFLTLALAVTWKWRRMASEPSNSINYAQGTEVCTVYLGTQSQPLQSLSLVPRTALDQNPSRRAAVSM